MMEACWLIQFGGDPGEYFIGHTLMLYVSCEPLSAVAKGTTTLPATKERSGVSARMSGDVEGECLQRGIT